ncbi:TMV resistance protein N-like [Cucumis melo var. makuwa]|uniref:TMV resistance protein N-like n=1 Tax=Cucumis melo var. makuwa TaxID=1194695 RepID=A0A5A7TXQ4_CUCMM|nr:TMV resistance protein N-like [Cucumis melo var. makuwa]
MIHESVGCLKKLEQLNLRQCTNLVKLPSYLRLKSLEYLSLSGCCKLESFPTIAENMKSLYELDLDFTAIKELPSSIGYLTKLSELKLNGCTNLISLPNTIYLLRNLENLLLSGCSIFGMFPYTWDPTIPTIQQDLALGEISREFLLMGVDIPEWFSYKTASNLVSASFRHYPDMERTLAAGVSFKVNGDSYARGARISCNIFICNKLHFSFSRPFLPSKSEYMWLITTSLAWGSMEVNDWNKVLVWFEVDEAHSEVNANITRCGVHVTEEIHGIQMDVKWPMVNYADFYQLEKLQSLDIEDLLLKSIFETFSCWSNSKAMLHAGYYDPEAIIDSNIQPMIFPLHVTYNGETVICGMEGMGDTTLANSLCNKFKWMKDHLFGIKEHHYSEALDNYTSFFHIRGRQLQRFSWSWAHHRKHGDGKRGTNITTHRIVGSV